MFKNKTSNVNKHMTSYYIDQCEEIFGPGLTFDSIRESVDATNGYYGGRDHFNVHNSI
jgi:hypothetical protein